MSNQPKERPILMNGDMVRAVLDGRKTQTRRIVKMPHYMQIEEREDGTPWPWMYDDNRTDDYWLPCPYGQPGDRLWVRETFHFQQGGAIYDAAGGVIDSVEDEFFYRASSQNRNIKWTPSIHMPRWASRIMLEIVSVRVERLQDISEDDAKAEGAAWGACGAPQEGSCKAGFAQLWESISGPGSWDANPWVWVVEFKVVKPSEA